MSWNERRENWSSQKEDARDHGEIDYARVIHSASFRRLQGKTQILNLGDSDFYRTRLTHSLEVAQIAGSITRQLAKAFPQHPATPHLPDRATIHAIGCTHDLGHPPFGHGGEVALNYCMRLHGGFEGNGQTLRIMSRLENFSASAGANLTRRTMLGLLKYPVSYCHARNPAIVPKLLDGSTTLEIIDSKKSKPPKCFMDSEKDVVDWILEPLPEGEREIFTAFELKKGKHNKPLHKSLDCSIMDVADDIAYGVHDFEDAIALGLVDKSSFSIAFQDRCPSFLDAMKKKYPNESENDVFSHMLEGLFGDSKTRKHFISRLVHHFVTACVFKEEKKFSEPLLRHRITLKDQELKFLECLKNFVINEVILSPSVQQLEFKGQKMVVSVFEALQSEPHRLLPRDAHLKFTASNNDPRVICDHVAGMTDTYLLRTFERLFCPRIGSVFDKL